MPTVAFVLHLVVSDPSPASLALIADDLYDDLIGSGHDVEEVRPWARGDTGLDLGPLPQSDPSLGLNIAPPSNPFGQ